MTVEENLAGAETNQAIVESERIVERMLAIDRRVTDKIAASNAKLDKNDTNETAGAICPHCFTKLAECGPNFWCEKCGELFSMDEVEWS